ncbi:hypothetical protein CSAL01_03016 [Colletotrichum salicis]|uniref:Uncharacterized protein n=1 Tax=Colletotrichum salicis TaxID=1209931 RepID=A0A135TE51_9PEZI|nr:hypothetical protein CSAL01_03016 [Colletotrichum salicis]
MQSNEGPSSDLPVAPSMRRSSDAAERSGLTDAQRTQYLAQFHIIELESYLKCQEKVSQEASLNTQALASINTQLHEVKRKGAISAMDIENVIEKVKAAISATNARSKAINLKEVEARAGIWTEIEGKDRRCQNLRTNIPAAAAFLHVVDTLDGIYHKLAMALRASQTQSYYTLKRENTRLQNNVAAQDDTIARLEQEIAELKQFNDSSSEGILINLID